MSVHKIKFVIKASSAIANDKISMNKDTTQPETKILFNN